MTCLISDMDNKSWRWLDQDLQACQIKGADRQYQEHGGGVEADFKLQLS